MPRTRLSPDQVDFIIKMKEVESSDCEIARRLGVSEGAIRHRLKRANSGKGDGRRLKPSTLVRYRGVIEQWGKDYEDDRRRPMLKTLYQWLRRDQGYGGSYDAFRRYIRKPCLQFHKKGAWVRVKTPPGAPENKGKMEKKIRDLFGRLDFRHRVFRDMADLQAQTDAILTKLEKEWRCGATDLTVTESFAYEKIHLRPLPSVFPALPLKETRTRVRRDGTAYFDGNYYQVPGAVRDRSVLCVNTGQEIIVWREGAVRERNGVSWTD